MIDSDTIAAIATSPGTGAIGIIKISGNLALDIILGLFRTKSLSKVNTIKSRHFYYGYIVDSTEKVIDECMLVFMRSPSSYTKEDVAEIHLHGGMTLLSAVLDRVLSCGARLAESGEFTKRAFLNGRIDLTQAEAVMNMINATSSQAAQMSVEHLQGKLGECINSLKDRLLDLSAEIEAVIDYPDEVPEDFVKDTLIVSISEIKSQIDELAKSYNYGKYLSDGLRIVICGKPNVGKSSLLNALLKLNRAIVTPIPGTTRDVIEEILILRGITVKLVDTAGIRETVDFVENIGIEKAKEQIDASDLVLMVCDASKELDEADFNILDSIKNKKSIILYNKIDLGERFTQREKQLFGDSQIVKASIKNGIGLSDLEDLIENIVYSEQIEQKSSVVVMSARHIESLKKAVLSLSDALFSLNSDVPVDVASIDIRDAWKALAEITGEDVSEELINRIFTKFCLGK